MLPLKEQEICAKDYVDIIELYIILKIVQLQLMLFAMDLD